MKGILSGIKWIISFFKDVWEFISSLISGLILALRYLFVIVELAIKTIGNLPDWLQAFGIITISITAMYFIIGRQAGKTE